MQAITVQRSACRAVRPHARRLASSVRVQAAAHINPSIKKDVEKVVDTVKTSELGPKAVLCRCWLSGKFPLCDGTHAKHNKETGDNVGPLIIDNDAKKAA